MPIVILVSVALWVVMIGIFKALLFLGLGLMVSVYFLRMIV